MAVTTAPNNYPFLKTNPKNLPTQHPNMNHRKQTKTNT